MLRAASKSSLDQPVEQRTDGSRPFTCVALTDPSSLALPLPIVWFFHHLSSTRASSPSPSTSVTSVPYEGSYRSLPLPTPSSQSTSDISLRGTTKPHRGTVHSPSKHEKEIFASIRLFSMVKIRISDTFTIKEHDQKQDTERKESTQEMQRDAVLPLTQHKIHLCVVRMSQAARVSSSEVSASLDLMSRHDGFSCQDYDVM